MRLHFIAIGGSVMHSLAWALAEAGHQVSGSDDQIYDPARSRLEAKGLLPKTEGWDAARITSELDAVILGMHAFEDNPELARARELGLPVYSFPEFIFRHSRHKQRIAIAGSYGKTTITAMVMHVLQAEGKAFDYLVGAAVPGFQNPVRLSDSAPIMLLEGDEYLSSKLDPTPKVVRYQPHMVVVSGISWDHINVFPTEAAYETAFVQLLQSIPKAGTVIYHEKDKRLAKLVETHTDADIHYLVPFSAPSYKVRNGRFQVKIEGHSQELKLVGKHNMANLVAAWKVCELLSVPLEVFLGHMATFEGAAGRLQTLHHDPRLHLIKDYAHAPAKVQATVEAVREQHPKHQLIACLELHTFSSLDKQFLPSYKNTLKKANRAIVMVDPHAVEKRRLPALSDGDLRRAFDRPDLLVVHSPEELEKAILQLRGEQDVLLMMSSGKFGGLELKELIG